MSELLDHKDTMEGWKAQYPEGYEFTIPSEAAVLSSSLIDKTLLGVTVARKKRGGGRPKLTRHKSFLEAGAGQKKRKSPMCKNCWQRGHFTKKCESQTAARPA